MKKNEAIKDPFTVRVAELMVGGPATKNRGDFKALLIGELQAYSRDVSENNQMSMLFAKLCDLVVDCQLSEIPQDAFKLIVASLLHEYSFSDQPLEAALQKFTGMDVESLENAREFLREKGCFDSVLIGAASEKRARKRTIMGLDEATSE